jgi:hypothetical protein
MIYINLLLITEKKIKQNLKEQSQCGKTLLLFLSPSAAKITKPRKIIVISKNCMLILKRKLLHIESL